jgi:hypothetical protein
MRNKLFIVAASLLLLASVANAQANFTFTKGAVANIPFAFSVGEQSYPAGVYTLQIDREKQMVVIRNSDRKSRIFLANNDDIQVAPRKSQLVFRRMGDHFFLTAIWTEGSNQGERLIPGKMETEMARQQTGTPETIAVQAQAR